MTPYRDSLWGQAPSGATHWGRWEPNTEGYFLVPYEFGAMYWSVELKKWGSTSTQISTCTDLHERPQAYRIPEQLIAEYRKEHGAEIEADAQDVFDKCSPFLLDHLLDDVLFHLVLIEKHLAAERARVEADAGGGS